MDGSKAVIGKMYTKRFHQLLIIPLQDYLCLLHLQTGGKQNIGIYLLLLQMLWMLEKTYVQWPTNLPPDLIPGIQAGGYFRLNINLYGSKSAPRLWYRCLVEFLKVLVSSQLQDIPVYS